ncbi:MAG: LamG-like jellyroll fold domain-containing protein [Flavobacteriales bacterium]
MKKTLLSIFTIITAFAANAQVTNGLVASYNFNACNGVDAIAPKANGNPVNISYADDRFGNKGLAASFNGANSTVNIGASIPKTQMTTGLTISAWIKADGVINQQVIASKWTNSINVDQFIFMIANGKTFLAIGRSGFSATGYSGSISLSPNTWYHVVATWDNSGRHRTYVNGTLDLDVVDPTFTAINGTSAASLCLGSQNNGSTRLYDGLIDDVKIYNRALDLTEVNSLYNEANPIVNNLVSKYTFNNVATDEISYNDAATTNIVYVNDRFSNPNQAIDITTTSHLNLSDSYDGFATGAAGTISYSCWVNFKTVNSTYQMIIMKQADSGCGANDRQYMLRLNSNNKLDIAGAGTLSPSNAVSFEGNTTIVAGQWYHIVLTYDASISTGGGGNKFSIYLDNVQETLTQNSTAGLGINNGILDGNAHIGIGAYLNAAGTICLNTQRLDAYFDDLFVYNKILTPAEISDLYNGTVGIEQANTKNNMSIYPNPVKNMLHIATEEKVSKLSIYNISGSLIRSYDNIDNTIDVSNLTKGMYILVVQSEKGISQNKFIKE